MAVLFVHPLHELPSQLRASGTRGSAVRAWLPQKSIARKTGAGPTALVWHNQHQVNPRRIRRGPFPALTSLSVAFPARKSWYSPITLAGHAPA